MWGAHASALGYRFIGRNDPDVRQMTLNQDVSERPGGQAVWQAHCIAKATRSRHVPESGYHPMGEPPWDVP